MGTASFRERRQARYPGLPVREMEPCERGRSFETDLADEGLAGTLYARAQK